MICMLQLYNPFPALFQLMDMLKYLFPVPKPESRRVMTFANDQDFISFRHHTYKKVPGSKDIELSEVNTKQRNNRF